MTEVMTTPKNSDHINDRLLNSAGLPSLESRKQDHASQPVHHQNAQSQSETHQNTNEDSLNVIPSNPTSMITHTNGILNAAALPYTPQPPPVPLTASTPGDAVVINV